jgi:phosphoenolpyruvate carboxylase
VLTAHPTEVQRKSILDCQLIISRLLSDRDRVEMTPDELADNEEALRRFMLVLWQTRMLRTSKLTVRDEINNGLEYYRYTFSTRFLKTVGLESNWSALRQEHQDTPAAARRKLDRRRPRRQPFVTHDDVGCGTATPRWLSSTT